MRTRCQSSVTMPHHLGQVGFGSPPPPKMMFLKAFVEIFLLTSHSGVDRQFNAQKVISRDQDSDKDPAEEMGTRRNGTFEWD